MKLVNKKLKIKKHKKELEETVREGQEESMSGPTAAKGPNAGTKTCPSQSL